MSYCPVLQHSPPLDWQDFERICHDLWQTIWQDPNTQMHGRQGQSQQGVDIYGQENGKWIGVQCKCKDLLTNKQLTENEILKEVDEAKKFSPPLSSLIIATTAPRDAKIQKLVRKITQRHRKVGLFKVSIASWHDINLLLCKHKPPLAQNIYPDLSDSQFLEVRLEKLFNDFLSKKISYNKFGNVSKDSSANLQKSEYTTILPKSRDIDDGLSNEEINELNKKMALNNNNQVLSSIFAQANSDIRVPEPSNELENHFTNQNKDEQDAIISEDLHRNNKEKNEINKCKQSNPLVTRKAKKLIKDKYSESIFKLFNKIQLQITTKNYPEALNLSKELDAYAEELHIDDVKPYIQVLLARLNINFYEVNLKRDKQYLEKAKKLLQNAESTAQGDLLNCVEALKAVIADFENCGSILDILKDKTNPYAMRARVATLIAKKQYSEAIQLIEEQKEVHEYWAESAIVAYLYAGQDEKADQILNLIENNSDYSSFIICSQKYAEILSLRTVQPQIESSKADNKIIAEKILRLLTPVLEESKRTKNIQGIFQIAMEIALRANLFLVNSEEIKRYSSILLSITPVPFVVLESIISQYIQAPADILKRIRKEHKNNINAYLLAAQIETQCFHEPVKAYQALKKVVKLAKTEQDKVAFLNCLLDLYQNLKPDAADDCYDLAMSLSEPNSLFVIKFRAGKYLRNNQADKVLEVLQKESDNDPVILQLKGNAFLQKNQFGDAAECFKKTGELVNSPEMYHKAGDFFLRGGAEVKAIECYELSIALQPDNIIVRSNLADSYTRTYIDLNRALKHLIALDKLKPYDSIILINIANCYKRLFEPEKSLEYYDKACAVESPMLAAIAGKAELLIAMKRQNEAFSHLESFKGQFENDPDFSLMYMNVAHYAGFDDKAHLAMNKILNLQKKGEIKEDIIQIIPVEKGMDMLRKGTQQTNEQNKNIHEQILKGQFPWLWSEARINGNKNFLWGWLRRTQELRWLFESPVNWAKFTIYSTNGFHAQKDDTQHKSLLPIKSPPANSTIVADISSLLTLHQLNLLDFAMAYFGKIIIPEEYLEIVLTQGKEVLLHQKSTYINAKHIKDFIDSGRISILLEKQNGNDIIKVDEYYTEKPTEEVYHIRDIIESLLFSGVIDKNIYKEILSVCSKPQTLKIGDCIQYKQKLNIESSTLRTFAEKNLLNQICEFFNIYISLDSKDKNNQIIREVTKQNDCIEKYYELWRKLKADPKVEFIRAVKIIEQKEKHDPLLESVLFATNIARENKYPLLADDRVLQALRLNESPDMQFPAFGTDALVLDLMQSEKLSKKESLNAFLKLMKWRYRFIFIPVELLKEAAIMYSEHAPGKTLKQIAEYVQGCMREPGLFYGIEPTEMKESMAIRLYLHWSNIIVDFIYEIWGTEDFTIHQAEKFTFWTISELWPACPKNFPNERKSIVGYLEPTSILSKVLFPIENKKIKSERIKKFLQTIKNVFNLTEQEYSKIILNILLTAKKDSSQYIKKISSEDFEKTQKQLLTQAMSIAFSIFEKMDLRSFMLFQFFGFIDKKDPEVDIGITVEILSHNPHPSKVQIPPGPILICKSKENNSYAISETQVLFCSRNIAIRNAAFEYYLNLLETTISSKTIKILQENKNDLLSEDDQLWINAAIVIYDALYDDALVFLAGVNQCFNTKLDMKEILDLYVPKILHPQMSSLDFEQLKVDIPEQEHDKIKLIINDIINNSEAIIALCKNYYHNFGHLPLAPKFSLGEVVYKWVNRNKKTNVWYEVWKWANNAIGPLPQYHACTVFVLYPEFIPARKFPELWGKIKSVICDSDQKNEKSSLNAGWQLRKDLNRHFSFHIEANYPNNNGTYIANFALLFTEKMASLFGDSLDTLSFYRKDWISKSLETSIRIWFTASPAETTSSLRYMNHILPAPWALSLMCLMGDNLEKLKPEKIPKKYKKEFNSSILSHLLTALPFNVKKLNKPTYAFELSLTNSINKWKQTLTTEDKKIYQTLRKTNNELRCVDTFIDEFRKISEKSSFDQMLIVSALKHKVFSGAPIEDAISKVLLDADWRNNTLLTIYPNTLAVIIEALSIMQVNSQNDWTLQLPHYIAELCEKTDDEELLNSLFFYVIHTCLSVESYSALDRLLKADDAGKYLKYLNEYRKRIKDTQKDIPTWVKGKLRSLMVAMNVY